MLNALLKELLSYREKETQNLHRVEKENVLCHAINLLHRY